VTSGLRLSKGAYAASIVAAVMFLVIGSSFALTIGAVDVALSDIGRLVLGEDVPAVTRQIIVEIRLPRILGAAVVGASLALAGAALQSVMKNPLADPYILGISAGASVGAAVAVLFGSTFVAFGGGSITAFLSALASVAIVYGVAQAEGRLSPLRLLLAGVALSSFASALTGFLLYVMPEATAVRGVMFWLMGGLGAADWTGLLTLAVVGTPGGLLLLGTARWQTLLLLGDDAATSMGLDVARARRFLIASAAVVTGAVVAFGGAIGFVGLVVPHAVRPWTGPDHARLLPLAALAGALLLVVMDTIARTILAPEELPVGILTGLLGAPFFLAILVRLGGRR
jgi:iron complex transport system permease protein